MNGPHTKAYVKNNRFTQLIDYVAQLNAQDGKPAGRAASQAAEHFITAVPAGRVRSLRPAEAAKLDYVPPPLSAEQIAYANAQAQALGVADGSGDEITDTADGPTEEEIAAMLPQRFRTGTTSPSGATTQRTVAVPQGVPATAAQGIATARAMPNFRNIQGFNLEKGVAVVDGIEYPLPEDDIRDMKKYALSIVLDVMVVQVAQALCDFGLPKEMAEAAATKLRETAAANAAVPGSMANAGREPAGTNETLSEVQPDESAVGVQPQSNPASRTRESLQEMSPNSAPATDIEWLLEDRGASGAPPEVEEAATGIVPEDRPTVQ